MFSLIVCECLGDLSSSLNHYFGRARNMRSCLSSSVQQESCAKRSAGEWNLRGGCLMGGKGRGR